MIRLVGTGCPAADILWLRQKAKIFLAAVVTVGGKDGIAILGQQILKLGE